MNRTSLSPEERRKLRSLYFEDARSTFYYRVRLNHVYVTLAEAGLVDDSFRDTRSKRKITTVCSWISRQKAVESVEEIVLIYGSVRDKPMSFFRTVKLVKEGNKLILCRI